MISKEEQNRLTENAWTKLRLRLEQDGLLVERTMKKSILKRYPVMKWAAAIAILFICSITTFLLLRPSNAALLTLHNGDGEPTLATTLEDGSVVFLGEQTSLHYPNHFAKNKREVTLEGKALFDISADAKKPFVIDTEPVVVEVIGTRFNIECIDGSSFFLSVSSGEVKTTLKKNNQAVYVKAGESVVLSYGGLQKANNSNPSLFNGYTNKIQFKDERLINVANVINKLSDSVQLNILPNIANRLITITITDSSPHTFAELICLTLDLELSKKNNTLTISSKN